MRNSKCRFVALFKDESGNLESALTLIPLMILLLSVLQFCIGVYSRDTAGETTQGAVAYAAMGTANPANLSPSNVWSSGPIALPLPGGGSLLVGEKVNSNPSITPLLPGGDIFNTAGIAVQE
jgi:hypothetical protein